MTVQLRVWLCLMVTVLGGWAMGGGATVPAARTGWAGPHSGWYTKQAAKLKGRTVDLLVLGDSITMGWQNPVAKRGGGKEVWEEAFWRYSSVNFALAGDRTEHLLWRITEGRQLDGYQAKVILLMIGINNAHQVRPGDKRPDTPEQAVQGIKAVLKTIMDKQPKATILLMENLPAHFPGCNLLKWTQALSRLTQPLADGERIRFIPLRASFMNDAETLKRQLFIDGIHLNEQGFQCLTQQLKPAVTACLPPPEPRSATCVEGGKPWQEWCRYIDGQVQQRKGKTIDVVLLGDHLLWGLGQESGQKAWKRQCEQWTCFNIAYAHDRTELLLDRVVRHRQLDGYDARLIILQAGSANFYAQRKVDSVQATAYGVKTLLEHVRRAQPQATILVLGMPPIHYPGTNLIQQGRQLDQHLQKMADGKKVFFLSMADWALDSQGNLKRELYDNGLMLNQAGFEKMTVWLKRHMEKWLRP